MDAFDEGLCSLQAQEERFFLILSATISLVLQLLWGKDDEVRNAVNGAGGLL